ncbi:MAG: hypothetical protein PHR81_10195 [Bacteroidales bacterium]|jgi:hypothetical protein|nr:hypothetical protein [Bacteroidales bacterium]MDD4215171.1 hypothetical protein [Bacteroidales bacterium]
MKAVFYKEIDNYIDFLKLKKKAESGHTEAKKLFDKIKTKYTKSKYKILYHNWYFENLRFRALQLHQYRAILEYNRYLKDMEIKKDFESIRDEHGEAHAREMIWLLYRKRL